jgi:hypothetical protein
MSGLRILVPVKRVLDYAVRPILSQKASLTFPHAGQTPPFSQKKNVN